VDARQQLEQLRLGRRLVSRRQLVKRQPERRYALAQVGVVRDDERRAALELALLEAPQEVEQAVAVAGDEDRDPFLRVRAGETPVHLEALGELREIGRGVLRELGLDPEEEAIAG